MGYVLFITIVVLLFLGDRVVKKARSRHPSSGA
jgi:hypothetical protein